MRSTSSKSSRWCIWISPRTTLWSAGICWSNLSILERLTIRTSTPIRPSVLLSLLRVQPRTYDALLPARNLQPHQEILRQKRYFFPGRDPLPHPLQRLPLRLHRRTQVKLHQQILPKQVHAGSGEAGGLRVSDADDADALADRKMPLACLDQPPQRLLDVCHPQ